VTKPINVSSRDIIKLEVGKVKDMISENEYAILTNHITKKFKDFTAVNDLNLKVKRVRYMDFWVLMVQAKLP
jgi:hypothetical protein